MFHLLVGGKGGLGIEASTGRLGGAVGGAGGGEGGGGKGRG